ncbi:protein LIKE COV 3-like [Vigna radiata var. radiata]|uniref:Protein LIKE COV 3-like n=1 Tax=Vigna radiata var. radiata TaxID=3916 RepID=A0A3Q0FAC6_VIGRR|nr:protein LIKE COV 3-like [Vigna radiata var. radiata]
MTLYLLFLLWCRGGTTSRGFFFFPEQHATAQVVAQPSAFRSAVVELERSFDGRGVALLLFAQHWRFPCCCSAFPAVSEEDCDVICSVILLPIAITFYVTWGFIRFVDGFFSPIYNHLGINIFGLGFLTSITFIFLVGIFMSSWLGISLLTLGEWFIKKMPLVSYMYVASKQISVAISPNQSSNAFKEVAIIRHPRVGEYAIGFITSSVILRNRDYDELFCVYVPINHLYLGDIYLIGPNDILRPNLSVREGIGTNVR